MRLCLDDLLLLLFDSSWKQNKREHFFILAERSLRTVARLEGKNEGCKIIRKQFQRGTPPFVRVVFRWKAIRSQVLSYHSFLSNLLSCKENGKCLHLGAAILNRRDIILCGFSLAITTSRRKKASAKTKWKRFFPHVWATQIQVIIQDGALKQSRHGDRIHPTKEVNPSQERVKMKIQADNRRVGQTHAPKGKHLKKPQIRGKCMAARFACFWP